jgi:hypothetical protein
MAIVEDEYVTGAGYAAVSDQVASSSQTAMLPGADDDSRGPARAANSSSSIGGASTLFDRGR